MKQNNLEEKHNINRRQHVLLMCCIFLFYLFLFGINCLAEDFSNKIEQTEMQISAPISWFAIEYRRPSDSEKNFLLLLNNGVLFSGDTYKINFTVSEPCYLYIFQIDGAKNIDRLFPMKIGEVLNDMNPIPADGNYTLPSKNQSFELDETVGIETIYCIASEKRVEIFEAEENQFQSIDKRRKEIDTLFEGFQQIVSEVEDDGYSFDFGDFLVELSGGKLACQFQFEHR